MTPGQEALAEAARLEAARVYSTTIREHRSTPAEQATARLEHLILDARQAGESLASIALRAGVSKATIWNTLRRLGAA